MVVRVIVEGVPGHIPIKALRREFDIICNTNVLSDTFYVRELEASSSDGKRYIALDFQNANDAKRIQSNLDGRRCQLSSHMSFILKARIHPEPSDRRRDNMELVSSSSWSVIPRELASFVNVPSAETVEKVVSSLQYKKEILLRQKEVIKAEREMLREKKKLAREYNTRNLSDSEEEITERANRGRKQTRSPLVFHENEKARRISEYRRRSNSKQRSSHKYVCRSSLSSGSRSNSPEAYRRAEKKRFVPESRRLRSPEESSRSRKRYESPTIRSSRSPEERLHSPKERSYSPKKKSRLPKDKSCSPKERSDLLTETSHETKKTSFSPKRRSHTKERSNSRDNQIALLAKHYGSCSPNERSSSPKEMTQSSKQKLRASQDRLLSPKAHKLESAKQKPRPLKEESLASKERSQSPKEVKLESEKLSPRSPKETSISPDDHELLSVKQRSRSLKEETRASKEKSTSPKEQLESAKLRPRSPKEQTRASQDRSLSPKVHELQLAKQRRSIKEKSRASKERSQSPKEQLQSSKLRPRSPKEQTRASQDRSLSPKVHELQLAKQRSRSLKEGPHSSKERSHSPEKQYCSPKPSHSLRTPRERSWSPRKRSRSPKEYFRYRRQHSPVNHSLRTPEYLGLTPKEHYRSRKEQNYFVPPHRRDNYRPKSPSFYRVDSYKHRSRSPYYERTSYSKRSREENYEHRSPHYDRLNNLKRPKEEHYKSRYDYYESPSKMPKDKYYSHSSSRLVGHIHKDTSHRYNSYEEPSSYFETKHKYVKNKTVKKTRYDSSDEDESSDIISSTSFSIRELKSPETTLDGEVKSRIFQKSKSADAKRLKALSIAVEQILLECKLMLRKEMALKFGLPLSREGKYSMARIVGVVEDIAKKRFKELSISWWNGESAEELAAYYRKQHSTEDDEKLVKNLISELKETKVDDEVEDGELTDQNENDPLLTPVEEDLIVSDDKNAETALKTDPLWNAVDEVLLDLKIDEFRVDSTQHGEIDDGRLEKVTTIVPHDTVPTEPVPENAITEIPLFTTPLKVLLRQMLRFIKNKEEECKYLYTITRNVIKDRLMEVMKGKDKTRNCEIIKAYREVYDKSGDEEFIKKIVEDIGDGKYELLTTQLELKTTLPPRDIDVP